MNEGPRPLQLERSPRGVWCPNCHKEIPRSLTLMEHNGPHGVVLLLSEALVFNEYGMLICRHCNQLALSVSDLGAIRT